MAARKVTGRPDDDRRREDQRPRARDKRFAAIVDTMKHDSRRRPLVGGQLHDERWCVAFEPRFLQQPGNRAQWRKLEPEWLSKSPGAGRMGLYAPDHRSSRPVVEAFRQGLFIAVKPRKKPLTL